MIKVFIDGQEGTTGLRISERLSARADLTVIEIDPELRKDVNEKKRLLNSADICFLCLPDAAAKESVSLVDNPNTIIIDASTAHRTEPGWAYGLPELSVNHREKIMLGKRICVPGCHASGFIASVYPLIEEGLIAKDYTHAVCSLTGYSGGGKSMIAAYESKDRDIELQSPRQYGLTQQHKHLKEMVHMTGVAQAPLFMPIVADFYSGMEVTVPLHLSDDTKMADIHSCLSNWYADAEMITVHPLGTEPSFMASNALSGKDNMEIFVTGNDERCLIIVRYDNLGKGASGAAVQCMNIALGLDETEGLSL